MLGSPHALSECVCVFILTSDIPDGEIDISVFEGFDVETDGWNGGDDFTELQLVEDGRLSGRVQSVHEDAHVGRAGEQPPNAGDEAA